MLIIYSLLITPATARPNKDLIYDSEENKSRREKKKKGTERNAEEKQDVPGEVMMAYIRGRRSGARRGEVEIEVTVTLHLTPAGIRAFELDQNMD